MLVVEGIEKQKAEEKEKALQASLLVEQQQLLERQMSEQKADTEQLKQRIAEWTDACAQKRQKAADERKKAEELLKKRYAHQVACRHTTLIQQAIRPQAVDVATDMLREKFSDPAQGDRFIASIVEFMETGHHEK